MFFQYQQKPVQILYGPDGGRGPNLDDQPKSPTIEAQKPAKVSSLPEEAQAMEAKIQAKIDHLKANKNPQAKDLAKRLEEAVRKYKRNQDQKLMSAQDIGKILSRDLQKLTNPEQSVPSPEKSDLKAKSLDSKPEKTETRAANLKKVPKGTPQMLKPINGTFEGLDSPNIDPPLRRIGKLMPNNSVQFYSYAGDVYRIEKTYDRVKYEVMRSPQVRPTQISNNE